jgi:hypothetical protein
MLEEYCATNDDRRVNPGADPETIASTFEEASPESGESLQQVLNVEVTGSTSMSVATANERLNASGNAGETSTVALTITNDGNTPLEGVELSSTPPTNWEVEQAIRPAVVNRKVWGGNRTWAGAHAQELLMSVLETCRRAGRSGLEFVSQTLRAFANPLLPRPILPTPR